MPVPTDVLITVGGVAIAVAGAAVYSYVSGNSASVDLDDDGNDEVTFGVDQQIHGTSSGTRRGGDSDGPEFVERQPTDGELAGTNAAYESGSVTAETSAIDPSHDNRTPERIAAIGSDLQSINGIGPVRASSFTAAGFETAEDLYYSADESLLDVDGIGERALSQIREDVGKFGFAEESGDEKTTTYGADFVEEDE